MRKLAEIINDVANDKMPTQEECYYALKAYHAMFNLEHEVLKEELLTDERQPKIARKIIARDVNGMYKRALSKSPKDWLED